jgi:signal recognition particle GTPase
VPLFGRGRNQEAEAATEVALERTRRSFLGRLGEVFAADVTEETWESLEEVLIGADVGVPTTLDVVERVRAMDLRKADDVRRALGRELVAILEAVEAPRGRSGGRCRWMRRHRPRRTSCWWWG